MHKRRLLKLADLLEKDAKNKEGIKFDLGGWGNITRGRDPVSCGTTACAMGLAALSGAFEEDGLHYFPLSSVSASARVNIIVYFRPSGLSNAAATAYDGFLAASMLFKITQRQAMYLFDAHYYKFQYQRGAAGERAVARRIRKFVKGKYESKRSVPMAADLGIDLMKRVSVI